MPVLVASTVVVVDVDKIGFVIAAMGVVVANAVGVLSIMPAVALSRIINVAFHRGSPTDAHLSTSTYYSLRSCAQHQTGK